jgi:hypothetical protein
MSQYCCCSDLVHIIIVCYDSRTGVYLKVLDFIIVVILADKDEGENFFLTSLTSTAWIPSLNFEIFPLARERLSSTILLAARRHETHLELTLMRARGDPR